MNPYKKNCKIFSIKGFNLIEILVSLAIGVFISMVSVQMMVSNRQTYEETSRYSEVKENIRFAMLQLNQSSRSIGFYGPTTTGLPDIVTPIVSGLTCLGNASFSDINISLWVVEATDVSIKNCLSHAEPDSDVVVVKYATFVNEYTLNDYFVAVSMAESKIFKYTGVGSIPFPTANILKYTPYIYYVKNNGSIPVMMRVGLDGKAVELSNGVEKLRVQLGKITGNDIRYYDTDKLPDINDLKAMQITLVVRSEGKSTQPNDKTFILCNTKYATCSTDRKNTYHPVSLNGMNKYKRTTLMATMQLKL